MAAKHDVEAPTSLEEKHGHAHHHIDNIESEQQSSRTSENDGMNFATDEGSLPPGYYRSSYFLGTMLAIGLGLLAGTSGFKFAGPVLTVINAEIGPVSCRFPSDVRSCANIVTLGSELHLDRTRLHIMFRSHPPHHRSGLRYLRSSLRLHWRSSLRHRREHCLRHGSEYPNLHRRHGTHRHRRRDPALLLLCHG